jgi:hypothetical protein
VKHFGAILFLALAAAAPAKGQIFWGASTGGYCAEPRLTVGYGGNPSFRVSLGGGRDCFRPWVRPCNQWGGFWPGNVWLGPVSLVSPNARRLPAGLGPVPTVPNPVAILPAAWVPQ